MEGALPASEAELHQVTALLQQAVDETPNERNAHLYGYPSRWKPPIERVQHAFGDTEQLLLAGHIDDVVVGMAIVSLDRSFPGGVLGIVEELYVEPPAREVGVGEALLDTAVQWCREHGCSGVEVHALPGARSAKNLCERSGFTARVLVMHRAL